jgi:hypothetical protein
VNVELAPIEIFPVLVPDKVTVENVVEAVIVNVPPLFIVIEEKVEDVATPPILKAPLYPASKVIVEDPKFTLVVILQATELLFELKTNKSPLAGAVVATIEVELDDQFPAVAHAVEAAPLQYLVVAENEF